MSYTAIRALLLCALPTVALAQAQPLISWQSLLTDSGGTPLVGPVNLQFNFYDTGTGGTPVWTHAVEAVALEGGVASLEIPVLRRSTATPVNVEGTVYLGVKINGGSELPRTPVRAAPSALTLQVPALIKGDVGGTVTSAVLEVRNTNNGSALYLNSTNGHDIYAKTGGRTAIYAETSHSNGQAFQGLNTSPTGYTWGVFGVSKSNLGTGVLGRAESPAGETTGVLGISTSADGFGGRFEGGRGIWVKAFPAQDHGGYVNAYAGLVENTRGGVSDDGLAIRVGTTGNPGVGVNFLGFFDGDNDLIGQVEGNGSGGVAFNTSGADYAESLPLLAPGEHLEAGDVVGVFSGAVTRDTEGSDQVMVVTDRAAVVGNTPVGEEVSDRVPVSFIGQVPVKMTGPVRAGDYVVASGRADGTALAVAPSAVQMEHIGRLLGRAWESSSDTGVRRVNVAVGLDRTEAAVELLQKQARTIQELEAKVDFLLRQFQGTGQGNGRVAGTR